MDGRYEDYHKLMGKWVPIPLNAELFKNLDESAITSSHVQMENCFITEAKGISRFPGFSAFADLDSAAAVYLNEFNNDLIASAGGRTFRLDQDGNVDVIPGASVLGGRRTMFSRAIGHLFMAAGDRIVNFDGVKNTTLSDDAPLASHVGYIDQFVLANSINTERFKYSEAGNFTSWPALNVLGATSKPDNISSLIVTPFNEVILAGPESVEQFERVAGANSPFFKRWSAGEGVSEPYTLCYADNAAWMLNHRHEFVRLSGQIGQSYSDQIAKEIKGRYAINNLDALNQAWAAPLDIKGQQFIVLQSPEATNEYGGRGITYVLDIRQSHWFELFGWDDVTQKRALWPVRSIYKLWGRTFLGGLGKIYEMTTDAYNHAGVNQRVYIKTANYTELGLVRIDRMRLLLTRGKGSNTTDTKLGMRVNRENRGFGRWQYKSLGLAGQNNYLMEFGSQGEGYSWQFEFQIDGDAPVEIRKIEAEVTPLAR